MLTSALSPLLIAFFATIGAIPLFRNFKRGANSLATNEHAVGHIAPSGGAGMLLGVVIALFYMDGSAPYVWDLVGAGTVLLCFGAWRERYMGRPDTAIVGTRYVIVASVISVVLLLLAAPLNDFTRTLSTGVLTALLVATPAAVCLISRVPHAGSPLPPGIVIVQLVLLALLGIGAPHHLAVNGTYTEFSLVAVPMLGALLAVMLYLLPTPWRSGAGTSLGVGARLCLGLVVAWGALKLLTAPGADGAHVGPVIWILAPPIVEAIRRLAVFHLESPRGASSEGRDCGNGGYSSAAVVSLAALLGCLSFAGEYLRLSATWSLSALLACVVLYVAAPMLMASWGGFRTPDAADASKPA